MAADEKEAAPTTVKVPAKAEKKAAAAPTPAPAPKKRPGVVKFVIAMGPNNQHRWQFFDVEGAVVVSSQGIPIKEACYEAIRGMKENALSKSRYERVDREGAYKFRLRAPNHKIVAESVVFKTREEREKALASTRLAPQAAVIDKA